LENSKNLSDDNKTVKTGLPMKNFTKDNLQKKKNIKIFKSLLKGMKKIKKQRSKR
jgi:hypothetical protein